MRPVIVQTFLTIDGVMQAPGGPEEDPSNNFTLGGWSVNHWDEAMEQTINQYLAEPFDLLLGRKTYEILAAHWPAVTDDPTAANLNAAHKHVATRSTVDATWHTTTAIDGDIAAAVESLKADDGPDIQVHGSWELIQTLLAHELVDEFRLWTFPVVVGSGKRLFAEGTPPSSFTLNRHHVFDTGVLMTTWTRSGPITPGSFALDQPTDLELQRRQQHGST